jgi:hypothetical protein
MRLRQTCARRSPRLPFGSSAGGHTSLACVLCGELSGDI